MAGARVLITRNTARPTLRKAMLELEGEGRELMLADMGEYLVRSTRDRAAKQVDPEGRPWRPLSKPYKKWKDKKRPGVPILKFDFHMLGDQFSSDVDSDGLVLGTNAPYGAIQHFGGTVHRPARSRLLSFDKDRENGMKRFARAGSKAVDHEKWATVKAYDIKIPARPWLGVSKEDEDKLVNIASDHVAGMFEGE